MHEPFAKFVCIALFCSLILISFYCFPGNLIYAQNYGFGGDDAIRVFSLQDLGAALEFRFEYEDQERVYPRVVDEGVVDETISKKRTFFEERVYLESMGAFYHPNLLEFTADGSFGLRQEEYRGDFVDNQDETLIDYDVNLRFLKKKPFNFNLFTNSFSTTINRDFFSTIKVDTSSYGGFVQYINDLFPVSAYFQSQTTDEDSFDFKRERTEDVAEFKVSNWWKDIVKSDLRYTYKKITDEVITEFEYIRNDINLINMVDYQKMHGISNISHYDTSGTINNKLFQVMEHFYVDHSDTFRTIYNYNFSRFETDEFNNNLHFGGIGFRHQLYDSLVTEVIGEFSLTDESNFEETYYGPRVSFDYRKIVPGGRFSLGYDFLYRITDREVGLGEGGEAVQRVFEEEIVLSDGQRTFLSNPNVILSSIVVKDEDRIILLRNVDYRVIQSGVLTEIRRLGLPNDTRVLVDYEFEVYPKLKYDTLGNTVYLRYDMKEFFSLYYTYNSVDYKLKSGLLSEDRPNILPEVNSNLFGAEVRWRWFDFMAEYEDDTSDLIPFKALRFNGRFRIEPTISSHFTLNGDHIKTDYREERGTITFDNYYASFGTRLTSFLDAEFEAGYLKEEGRDIDDRIWRFVSEFTGRFRSIEFELRAEYSDRDQIREDRDEFLLEFSIIRYFDIL